MNCKLSKIVAVSLLVVGCVYFSSCGKDEKVELQNTIPVLQKGVNQIPNYANAKDFLDAVESSLLADSISIANNPKYEYVRKSVGYLMDSCYNRFLSDAEFGNETIEVEQIYLNNINFLDTILMGDVVALAPKFYYSPFRYVANTDGMFSIGGYVYKIFKSRIVSVSSDSVNYLYALTEDDLPSVVIDSVEEESTTNSFHSGCDYNWRVTNNPNSPNDRIHIKLKTNVLNVDYVGDIALTFVQAYNLHRNLCFWFVSKHTLNVNGNVKFHKSSSDGSEWEEVPVVFSSSNTSARFVYTQFINECSCIWPFTFSFRSLFLGKYTDNYHYLSCTINAFYPGHPTETLII